MSIPDFTFKQREALYLRHDVDHDATTIFSFMVKRRKSDTVPVIQVDDADIRKREGTYILIPLSASNLNLAPGDYVAEIKSKFSDTNIDKSDDLIIRIEKSVLHD